MWPKTVAFLRKKLPEPEFYKGLIRKTTFFEGWFWFNFNNLLLALSIALKFYTNVAKVLKVKVRKFLKLIPMFVEVTGEKLVRERVGGEGGRVGAVSSPIINRVKEKFQLELSISY